MRNEPIGAGFIQKTIENDAKNISNVKCAKEKEQLLLVCNLWQMFI